MFEGRWGRSSCCFERDRARAANIKPKVLCDATGRNELSNRGHLAFNYLLVYSSLSILIWFQKASGDCKVY